MCDIDVVIYVSRLLCGDRDFVGRETLKLTY